MGDIAEIVEMFEREMPIKLFWMDEDKREHEEEAPLRMIEAVNLLGYIAPSVKTLDWLFDELRNRVSRRFIRAQENGSLERAFVDGKVRIDNEAVYKYLDAFDAIVLELRDNITLCASRSADGRFTARQRCGNSATGCSEARKKKKTFGRNDRSSARFLV